MLPVQGLADLVTATDNGTSETGLTWAERTSSHEVFPLSDVFAWLVIDFFLYTVRKPSA